MVEKFDKYNEKFKTIRIRTTDKVELDKVHYKTRLDRVDLIGDAVLWLKKKYRIKDEQERK